MSKISLPRYFLTAVLRHYELLAERCIPPRSDDKAMNAQRLAKGEIRRLKKILQETNTRRMKIEELHIGMLVRSDKYPHRILRVEAIMPTRTYVSYEDNGVRYRVYNLTHEDLKHIEF